MDLRPEAKIEGGAAAVDAAAPNALSAVDSSGRAPRAETAALLLLDEVARICRTSINTVRFWVQTGKLPSIRPGRRRLVRQEDLERFLLERPSRSRVEEE